MSFQNALELWNGIDLEIVEDSNETIHCCFYLHLVSLKIACVNAWYMHVYEWNQITSFFFLLKVVSASQELICNTMWWLYKAIICVMYIYVKLVFFYSNIPMLIYMYFIYCQYHVNVRICNWAFKTKFLSCLYRLYVFKYLKIMLKISREQITNKFHFGMFLELSFLALYLLLRCSLIQGSIKKYLWRWLL